MQFLEGHRPWALISQHPHSKVSLALFSQIDGPQCGLYNHQILSPRIWASDIKVLVTLFLGPDEGSVSGLQMAALLLCPYMVGIQGQRQGQSSGERREGSSGACPGKDLQITVPPLWPQLSPSGACALVVNTSIYNLQGKYIWKQLNTLQIVTDLMCARKFRKQTKTIISTVQTV